MRGFQELYTEYYEDVYRFLLKLTGYRHSLAEELTQDTFYHAFVSFASFKGKCHVKTWLIQIARNRFFTHLRKTSKHRALALLEETRSVNPLTAAASPYDEVETRELAGRLLSVIRTFDGKTRDVILYRLFSDLPYAQIAAVMGISEGSAKVIYFRGKVALQSKLKEDYGYEI